ncbi:hypothetical protein ACTZWT_18960 [Rhodopseudomonas sp. NSM]|uniref:hypothetical protein n=1 Tax=Rhodopseudomonas sp. NSM TaxID=3457630 RepID=UPI0040357A4A
MFAAEVRARRGPAETIVDEIIVDSESTVDLEEQDRTAGSIHTLVMRALDQVSIRNFASSVRSFSEFESKNTENQTSALP